MKKKHGLENSYKKLRMGGMFYSKGGGADMSTKQKAIAASTTSKCIRWKRPCSS